MYTKSPATQEWRTWQGQERRRGEEEGGSLLTGGLRGEWGLDDKASGREDRAAGLDFVPRAVEPSQRTAVVWFRR